MKITNFIILVLVISFGCETKVFAEYDKYIITKETVVRIGMPPSEHWQDTICIVHEGEILKGQIATYYGIENSNYINICPDIASSWGYIPSDYARVITQEEIDTIKAEKSDGITHSLFKWYLILVSVIVVFIFFKYQIKNKFKQNATSFNVANKKYTNVENYIESELKAIVEKNRFTTKNIFRVLYGIVFEVIVAYFLIHFSVSTEIIIMALGICGIPMYYGIYFIVSEKRILKSCSLELFSNYQSNKKYTFPNDKWFENIPRKLDDKFYKWLKSCRGGTELLSSGRIYYSCEKKTNSFYKNLDIEKEIFDDIMDIFGFNDHE
jgi:hypothetical protein